VFFLTGSALSILFLLTSGPSLELSNATQVAYSQEVSPTPKVSNKNLQVKKLHQNPTKKIKLTPTAIRASSASAKPTAKPSISPKPTIKRLINLPSVIPTSTPAKTDNASSDVGLQLMKQINDFRTSKGLSALSTDGHTCAFASVRAGEIVGSFNHDGFRNRIDSKSLPYPSYSSVAENIAMNSDPNAVVNGWINSPGHNENMSKDVPYGCVGRNGNYYVFEAWKP
jgi:uncharacterized protein YkwD